uniref:Uncharacterized protein n=1 Tax=Oryza brachyantha TaxID=4533 RepID=J3L0I0_ORYBR
MARTAAVPATLLLGLFAVAVLASGLVVPDEQRPRRHWTTDSAELGIHLGTTHSCVGVEAA